MAQNDAGGRLVAALEQTWRAIARRHPELPPAVLIVGAGSGSRHVLRLGHFAAERWRLATEDRAMPEVFIGGEGLARGAGPVLATLLHEAAHALASVRGIQETSRRGQYHNKRFRLLAEELGLHVDYDTRIGWSPTTLPDTTASAYAGEIAALQSALTAVRRPEPPAGRDATGRSRTVPMALCGCPRRIRVAPSVLAAGPIICAVCEEPFTFAEQGVDEVDAPARAAAAA